MKNKITVNMVSESDVSVKGHGVHSAYIELISVLKKQKNIKLIKGRLNQKFDCDIIHFHTIGHRTYKKLFQVGPKKVVSAHIIPESFIGSLVLAKYWKFLAKIYMKWYYGRADKVLAVSKMVADSLKNDLKINPNKIAILYNSIDMQKYLPHDNKESLRDKHLLDRKKIIVTCVGQVQPRKRIDTFIYLANQFKDIQFIWVGGINFKGLSADYVSMSHLIKNAPTNLKITGVISHNKVIEYLHLSDIFCLPAEQENHPMSVLEAAGSNLPIILRDLKEYDDTFKGDVLLCKDDKSFKDAIELMKNKKNRDSWIKKSNNIKSKFDSNKSIDKLVKIYEGLVNG